MEEQEEVSTKRFTFAFKQELSTFKVPFMHGSIKFACHKSQTRNFSIRSVKTHKMVNIFFFAHQSSHSYSHWWFKILLGSKIFFIINKNL